VDAVAGEFAFVFAAAGGGCASVGGVGKVAGESTAQNTRAAGVRTDGESRMLSACCSRIAWKIDRL